MPPNRVTTVPPGYEMIRELGRGGLGVVVLARHEKLDRRCAVKRVLAGPARSADAVSRFRREAQALARLDHPAIVRLYDVVAVGGALFIVMEHVDGHNLRHLLDGEALPPTAAVAAALDIADALTHAARRGVVHRDIKPDNVLVLPDGRAKLADFGIARLLGDTTTFRTSTGAAIGSLPYMAPEQILGDADIGPPADVYSYCAMAYEVTVGQRPFPAERVDDLIESHLHHTPERPEKILAGYPSHAADSLMAGMAKDPSLRPPVDVIAAALRTLEPTSWPVPHRRRSAHPAREAATTAATMTPTHANEPAQPLPARPDEHASTYGSTGVDVRASGADDEHLDTWIEPAVFRPAPTARRHPRTVHVAVTVAIAIGLAIAWLATHAAAPKPHIAVVSATVVILEPDHDTACTDATFDIEGHLVTNGRPGTLRAQWTSPDGVTRPPLSLRVRAGQTDLRLTLRFTIPATQALRGAAILHVLNPTTLTVNSPEIIHACS